MRFLGKQARLQKRLLDLAVPNHEGIIFFRYFTASARADMGSATFPDPS